MFPSIGTNGSKLHKPSFPIFLRNLTTAVTTLTILAFSSISFAADVRVEWQPSSDARVAYYELYWGKASGDYRWTQQSASTSAILNDLASGETYYIAAKACADGAVLCSGFSDEVTTTVAEEPLQARFEIDVASGIAPHAVQFIDQSAGMIDGHTWEFGDGTSSNSPSPAHVYKVPGTYTVTLTVTDGARASTARHVNAIVVQYPAPIADFTETATFGSAPLTVTFTDDSAGQVDSYRWDFGDGTNSTTRTAVHTYSTPGDYSVSLTVQGLGGATTKTKPHLVAVNNSPPVADFNSSTRSGRDPLRVSFSNRATGAITGFLWDFGDGSSSADANPTHVYQRPGDYDVSLTVTGPGGDDTLEMIGYVHVEAAEAYELPLEVGEIAVDHQWQRVDFERSFTQPVVIVKPLSTRDDNPAVVRVTRVDNDGFWVRIQEWDYLNDQHTAETVTYMVIERGTHQLPDGSWIEADLVTISGKNGFTFAGFGAPFALAPVVMSNTVTTNDSTAVTTRMKAIDRYGFVIALQEQEPNIAAHGNETVAYIAWEPSTGLVNGLKYEVDRTLDEVTHAAHTIYFSSDFIAPPFLLADMQTTDGGDTANLRWRDKTSYSVRLWVDEEQAANLETRHTTETVGYIAIATDELPQPPQVEVGELQVTVDWQRVELELTFSDPVVIAKPVSANDPDPVIVRVGAIDGTGFDIRLQEWDYLDGLHAPETVTYMVVERGRHRLPNGTWLEANRLNTKTTNAFATAFFEVPFDTEPVVLTAVTTYAGQNSVTTRVRNVRHDGFQVGLEEQEDSQQAHPVETIDFVAWQPSIGEWDSLSFEVGRTQDVVTHSPHTIVYATRTTQPPIFLADMQSTDGADSASLRCGQQDFTGVDVWVQEEQSKDRETRHVTETVGYFVFHDMAPSEQ